MLIVNDRLPLAQGYFSEAFLGYYFNDDTGEKREVIVKQVTDRIVLNHIASARNQSQPTKRSKKVKVNKTQTIEISKSEFRNKQGELMRLLAREGNIAQKLFHPNIIRFIGGAKYRGRMSIIYEYADCGTLKDRLDRHQRIPLVEWVDLLDQISCGLSHIHGPAGARGLIHMDICPSNIFYFSNGRICLGDFGLSQQASPDVLGKTSCYVCKTCTYSNVRYSPPEVIHHKTAYLSSDLWSLGATLFEALTGKKAAIKNEPLNKIMTDTRGRQRGTKYIDDHTKKSLKKVKQSIQDEIGRIFKELFARPDRTLFRSADALQNYLNGLRGKKTSDLGAILRDVSLYRDSMTKAYGAVRELVQLCGRIPSAFQFDVQNKKYFKETEKLLDVAKEKRDFILQQVKEAHQYLGCKTRKSSIECKHISEVLDLMSGRALYFYASCCHQEFKCAGRLRNQNKSPAKVKALCTKTENTIKDIMCEGLQQAMDSLGRACQKNPYGADACYLHCQSQFNRLSADINYSNQFHELVDILVTGSDTLLHFARYAERRPSFLNIFNMEKLLAIYGSWHKHVFEPLMSILEIAIRNDISDQEKEDVVKEALGKLTNIKDFDIDELTETECIQKIVVINKNISAANTIRSQLFSFMFQSLIG